MYRCEYLRMRSTPAFAMHKAQHLGCRCPQPDAVKCQQADCLPAAFVQITTYKVHKVDLSGSAHSSLDERASRAMSGLSLCGLGGSRVALNPLSDSGGLETPRTLAAFADASPKAFGDGTAFPVRHDSADDELTLDFTETGACILREASPVRPMLSSQLSTRVNPSVCTQTSEEMKPATSC